MTLRRRVTLALALAGLLPVVVATALGLAYVRRSQRAAFAATQASVMDGLGHQLTAQAARVEAALASLLAPSHPLSGVMLRELIKQPKAPDPVALRVVREQALPFMRGLGLDGLVLADGRGLILVAPHLRSLIGTPVTVAPEGSPPRLGWRAHQRAAASGDRLTSSLMFSAEGVLREGGQAVHVVIAQALPRELVTQLSDGAQRQARVVMGAEVVVPAPRAWLPTEGELRRWPLRDADGQVVGAVEVLFSTAALTAMLWRGVLIAVGVMVLAIVLAFWLGARMAQRMVADLDELGRAVSEVGRGNMAYRVAPRATAEVARVGEAFNRMLGELEASSAKLAVAERVAAWQDIARRLAHEVKNPLTPIQLAMETLRKAYAKQHPAFAEILDESTTAVLAEATRLRHIITEFAQFARLPKANLVALDLSRVLTKAAALQPEVRLALAAVPRIAGDEAQLTQVFVNLVSNACEAMASDAVAPAPIDVAIEPLAVDDTLWVRWTVADRGPGVPDEAKLDVFAPYVTTKLARGGTGLGLAIVQRIIVEHHGRVRVLDREGGGAVIEILLPPVGP